MRPVRRAAVPKALNSRIPPAKSFRVRPSRAKSARANRCGALVRAAGGVTAEKGAIAIRQRTSERAVLPTHRNPRAQCSLTAGPERSAPDFQPQAHAQCSRLSTASPRPVLPTHRSPSTQCSRLTATSAQCSRLTATPAQCSRLNRKPSALRFFAKHANSTGGVARDVHPRTVIRATVLRATVIYPCGGAEGPNFYQAGLHSVGAPTGRHRPTLVQSICR